jgi:glycosyltransferase involved in cell wall biosynthesis
MSSEVGWRGGEQQVAYLLEDLFLKKIQNILAVRRGSRLENFCTERNIPYLTLRFSGSADLASAITLKNFCRTERIDIIHLHSSKAQGIGVLAALFGLRVPMVLSRRVTFLPGRNPLSKWKYNHPQIKKILCVSEMIRTIMKGYVKDGDKCVTVYSGVDLGKLKDIVPDKRFVVNEFQLDHHKPIVVTIGAVDQSKDHFTFVDTIDKVLKKGVAVQALVLGDGPLRGVLEEYVRTKSLEKEVRFAGYRKDVLKILMSADIFMMTSREEGLGTSLLDAFLARIPVVATAAGGIPEIVRHKQTGLLAPVMDSDKLAENIVTVLHDNGLRDEIVQQAHVFVRNFSKEATSEKTLKLYQTVLNKSI